MQNLVLELERPAFCWRAANMITLRNVHFRYPETPSNRPDAIRHVELGIARGEYIALVGANGSGKTTLARLMAGLLKPTQGRIDFEDKPDPGTPRLPFTRLPVGLVFQNAEDQVVGSTVEEDVAFGLENIAVPADEIHERVEHALRQMGLWEIRTRQTWQLSGGQTQRLAIAGMVALAPGCMIFDEPTAQLDPRGRDAVLQTLEELNQRGLTIIHITHYMREACLAQRVIVLHQGEVALDGLPGEVFTDVELLRDFHLEVPQAVLLSRQIARLFPGALPRQQFVEDALLQELEKLPARPLPVKKAEPIREQAREKVIEVEGLEYTYMLGTPLAHRALNGVEMQVARGSAHGLIGQTGSGKSTLLQHLNGIMRPQKGSVRLGGCLLNDKKVSLRQIISTAGLVMQNPEMQFFEHFVGDEIAFGPKMLGCDQPLAERVFWAMELVGLDFEAFKDRDLQTLSGGEKRKVALASVLANKPSVLLLDEPLAGLDPLAHRDIRQRLGELGSEGITLLLSSHNLEDIGYMTAQTTLLYGGRSVSTTASSALLRDEGTLTAAMLRLPFSMRVAQLLERAGLPIPAAVCTAGGLVETLAGLRSLP